MAVSTPFITVEQTPSPVKQTIIRILQAVTRAYHY